MVVRAFSIATALTTAMSEALDASAAGIVTVDAAIDAAKAIGAGDASVEILAIETAFDALKLQPAVGTGAAKLVLDMSLVTTKNQLVKVLDTIRRHFDSNNLLLP